MRVLVLYSHRRRGSTYHCVAAFRQGMSKAGAVDWDEMVLEDALQEHCRGCFACILRGAEFCPHHESMKPLLVALLSADAILMSSPVYGLNVSGLTKTLIDHTCYMWLPHRPHPEMFDKVGAVFTTAAGAGVSRTLATMSQAMKQLGLRWVGRYGFRVAASSWSDVSPGKKAQIERKMGKAGQRFFRRVERRRKVRHPLSTYFLLAAMRKMIAGYDNDNLDRQYWRDQGWLSGNHPLRSPR